MAQVARGHANHLCRHCLSDYKMVELRPGMIPTLFVALCSSAIRHHHSKNDIVKQHPEVSLQEVKKTRAVVAARIPRRHAQAMLPICWQQGLPSICNVATLWGCTFDPIRWQGMAGTCGAQFLKLFRQAAATGRNRTPACARYASVTCLREIR